MTEKEQIEKATAEKFVDVYNAELNTSFVFAEQFDHPDIICKDQEGNYLNLEITLTEDRDKDIQALLGRSEHRNIEYVKKHGISAASALSGNVMENAYRRILKKMSKDYGTNVALVVRDTSPLEWSWDMCKSELTEKFQNVPNPFDKGVWILTTSPRQNKIFRIL